MPKCDFCEIRGWGGNAFCMKKDNYVDNSTYDDYCNTYRFDSCPIYRGGSSGGCYLTTACVEQRGLSDDCIELTTLRSFRDTYMRMSEIGEKDVEEYYQTAPKIVNAINQSDEADKVYENIYYDIIQPCVSLIQSGKYEDAYKKYKTMVQQLEDKYC